MELTVAFRTAATLVAAALLVGGIWWLSKAREASEDYEVALSIGAYVLFAAGVIAGLVELWRQ